MEHLYQLAKQSLTKVIFRIFFIHFLAFSSFQLYYSHLIIYYCISDYTIISLKLIYRIITIWAHIDMTVNEHFRVTCLPQKSKEKTCLFTSPSNFQKDMLFSAMSIFTCSVKYWSAIQFYKIYPLEAEYAWHFSGAYSFPIPQPVSI